MSSTADSRPAVVMFSSWKFLLLASLTAAGIFVLGLHVALPTWLLALEIFATIAGLFAFGSFSFQIHKNALTYGMALVIGATFFSIWWPRGASAQYAARGWEALTPYLQRYLLTWHGLDSLIHADTMLFILGLTFFVAIIAQTRLLETVTFILLQRNNGAVVPTVLVVTAIVAAASGVLDGVSMIGLTIRTLVIILLLVSAPAEAIRYAVMVCTVVTTVCGMWLAYGEPPNLIMKSNLVSPEGETYLGNAFFLRYCLPCAIASYFIVAIHIRKRFARKRVDLAKLDFLDTHVSTVRFLQAERHGEVLTPVEFIRDHEHELNGNTATVLDYIRHGKPLGVALVKAGIPEELRQKLLGKYVREELAESLDKHYQYAAANNRDGAVRHGREANEAIALLTPRKIRAQWFGAAGVAVFVALLVVHSIDHRLPLAVSSFAGFAVSLLGIINIPRMRALAFHEARHEYAEYYFLFPLFLSIALLTKSGFFDQLREIIDHGVQTLGMAPVALLQFFGCTGLSSILDNNVVADFASRALLHLDVGAMHLFALAQIAGYAVGGCWTHIGSAQSVVAFSFIRRDVDENYTPLEWVREMTPIVLQTCVVLGLIIIGEGLLLSYWRE